MIVLNIYKWDGNQQYQKLPSNEIHSLYEILPFIVAHKLLRDTAKVCVLQ